MTPRVLRKTVLSPRSIGMTSALLGLLLTLIIGVPALSEEPSPTDSSDPPRQGVVRTARPDAEFRMLFERGNYEEAARLLEVWRRDHPADFTAAYNLACARSMLGQRDAAAELLLEAIKQGFTAYFTLERDPHLTGVREHKDIRLVLAGRAELLEARAEAELESLRRAFEGSAVQYRFQRISDLRVVLASSFDAAATDSAVEEMRRVARWAEANLFGPPADDPARPDPWCAVVLPSPEDFARLISNPMVGGTYDHEKERLVTRDIGPGLRHEFFHVLHWRRMARDGREDPLWVMEGLAALIEDADRDEQGDLHPVPSWRTNIVGRLARAGRLTPWTRLHAETREQFMTDRVSAKYAQARAIMLFIVERRRLDRWYEHVRAGEPPLAALAAALELTPEQAEREFKAWARQLPEVAEPGKPGRASLGVALEPGKGDGPRVASFRRTQPGDGPERLRLGDTILEINARPTRTLDDLARVLGEHQPGDVVRLTVRRGTSVRELVLTLVPTERGAPP